MRPLVCLIAIEFWLNDLQQVVSKQDHEARGSTDSFGTSSRISTLGTRTIGAS